MTDRLIFILAVLSIIGHVFGCAESSEEDPAATDTDVDTDTDADSDSDIDIDVDADTDTGSQPCECAGNTLPCCDGCYFYDTDHICDAQYELDEGCGPPNTCEAPLLNRYRVRYCDGITGSCSGPIDTDYTEWQDAGLCGPNEVCVEDDAGIPECMLDLPQCPAAFGDTICVPGGIMSDCPYAGCPTPLPSMTQSLTFGNMGAGDVVKLDLYVTTRGGIFPGMPFSDITATMTHGGTTAGFYNGYVGEAGALGLVYDFPVTWYLPHFDGLEMGGTWDLYFEDSAFSGSTIFPADFEVTQWCLTALTPGSQTVHTSGSWPASTVGAVLAGSVPTSFEMQLDDIVNRAGQDVWIELDITHPAATDLAFGIKGPDGTELVLKLPAEPTVEPYYQLTGFSTDWLTGRWALQVVNTGTSSSTAATLNSWSVNVGTMPSGADAGPDGGGPDAGP